VRLARPYNRNRIFLTKGGAVIGRRTRVASSFLAIVFCSVAFGALMQHSETTIPIPVPGEKTSLAKLEYRARFVASIDTVTLELEGAEGADPVVARWAFSGSNTDGQAHRVEVAVRLLDDTGKQVGAYSVRSILAPGAKDQPIKLSTKVKADDWKASKRARIFADWMS
jgi:hypothetical protein